LLVKVRRGTSATPVLSSARKHPVEESDSLPHRADFFIECIFPPSRVGSSSVKGFIPVLRREAGIAL